MSLQHRTSSHQLVFVSSTDSPLVDVCYKPIPNTVYQQKICIKFEVFLWVLCIYCTYPYVNLSIAAAHICSSFKGVFFFLQVAVCNFGSIALDHHSTQLSVYLGFS